MIDLAIFFSLFTLGLVSSTHCIGMCGGIMGALTMAIPANARTQRWIILISYNLGRIASYAFMGLLVGFFAEQFAVLGGGVILRVLAGSLLIAMGLYLMDWWRGLTKLEVLGRYLWVYLQPLGKPLMPVNNMPKALLLGALWGWLPCGLVYTALATAITQPAPTLAAGAMLAFGLGTLPAVLTAGLIAHQLSRVLQQRPVRMGLAFIIIAFGIWTILGGVGHLPGHNHQQHSEHNHLSAPAGAVSSAPDHSAMHHEHNAHAPILERQRTDQESKLEDDSLESSSVDGHKVAPEHHHEHANP